MVSSPPYLARPTTSPRCSRASLMGISLIPQIVQLGWQAGRSSGLSTALVRSWVLQGLAAEREDSVEQTVEALAMNIARLRQQLAESQAS